MCDIDRQLFGQWEGGYTTRATQGPQRTFKHGRLAIIVRSDELDNRRIAISFVQCVIARNSLGRTLNNARPRYYNIS